MKPPQALADHPEWPTLARLGDARIERHGDTPRWRAALSGLPDAVPEAVALADRITARGTLPLEAARQLRRSLMGLHPWRKGPYRLFGVDLDTEWRSDLKWQRIAPALGDLSGQRVLDVGCGNGYFGWRLLGAGAASVLGVDPSVLFYFQHEAIRGYLDRLEAFDNTVLPLTFEELPAVPFDLVLSMGVVYHRPDPADHIRRLHACTRPGGRVLLESLVVSGGASLYPAATGDGRYARMRNVSIVPSLEQMRSWLVDAGFVKVVAVDVTTTTTAEQRRTDWMTFDSLAEALDPDDPGRTVEGHPAPVRAAMIAERPG